MDSTPVPIHLWVQLAVSAGFVLLMVIVHGLRLNAERLEKREMDLGGLLTVATTALFLFLLHILEIVVFALFYLAVESHIRTLADAIYYSASAYATLGTADANPAEQWRLIGAFEALIGFVLIGWSTAFVARTMAKLQA